MSINWAGSKADNAYHSMCAMSEVNAGLEMFPTSGVTAYMADMLMSTAERAEILASLKQSLNQFRKRQRLFATLAILSIAALPLAVMFISAPYTNAAAGALVGFAGVLGYSWWTRREVGEYMTNLQDLLQPSVYPLSHFKQELARLEYSEKNDLLREHLTHLVTRNAYVCKLEAHLVQAIARPYIAIH